MPDKTYILGCDPGNHGAAAIISASGPLDAPILIPFRKTYDGKIDVHHLIGELRPYTDNIAFALIEDVHALFGASSAASFTFGKSYSRLETVLDLLPFPVATIPARTWQHIAFSGIEKVFIESSRAPSPSKADRLKAGKAVVDVKAVALKAAGFIFPDVSFIPKGCRTPHDGCVDAALIAYYGRLKYQAMLQAA